MMRSQQQLQTHNLSLRDISPYKLHNHTDVLLCMRAVKWHAQRMGANLLTELVVLQLKSQIHDRQGLLKAAQVRACCWSAGQTHI
jgi:hypothetical protein